VLGDDYATDVHVMDTRSGEVSRLAARTGVLFVRAWSPAADELLTLREDEEGVLAELVALRPDGRARLVDGDARTVDYSWSPDGDSVAYTADDALQVMEADGEGRRRLIRLEGEAVENFPAWSPDGRMLAFRRDGDLWVVAADGGGARRVADGPLPEGRAIFWLSTDEIAFTRERPEPVFDPYVVDVLRASVDSGDVRPWLEQVVPAALSPGGSELLFLRPHANVRIREPFAPVNLYSVRLVPVAGGEERTVGVMSESVLRHGSRPVWQPRPAPIARATGAFAPRKARVCERLLEEFRRRLAG
jgi:dipeptidyl aminopeptidase/acylaminoacyl peptidase